MEPDQQTPSYADDGIQPVRANGSKRGRPPLPRYPDETGRLTLRSPLHTQVDSQLTSFLVETKLGCIYVKQCGPLDINLIADWSDSVLHNDYYFRKGHWQAMVRRPDMQVYAIAWTPNPETTIQELIGIAVIGHQTSLYNLYLDPAWRRQGIGGLVIETLQPETIRAKVDSVPGDPTPFYRKMGYRIVQEGCGKHGTITVLQRPRHMAME